MGGRCLLRGLRLPTRVCRCKFFYFLIITPIGDPLMIQQFYLVAPICGHTQEGLLPLSSRKSPLSPEVLAFDFSREDRFSKLPSLCIILTNTSLFTAKSLKPHSQRELNHTAVFEKENEVCPIQNNIKIKIKSNVTMCECQCYSAHVAEIRRRKAATNCCRRYTAVKRGGRTNIPGIIYNNSSIRTA